MVKIKKIGVSSAAKIYGMTLGVLGFVFGIFYTMLLTAFGGLLGTSTLNLGAMGLIFPILFPIIYGVLGFVVGALGAVVYNFVASKIGGLEIQLSNEGEIPL